MTTSRPCCAFMPSKVLDRLRVNAGGAGVGEKLGIAGSGAIATGLAACATRTPGHLLWARSDAWAVRATKAIAKACERLGGLADGHAVLSTTTSSLSVGELAQASGHAERFVGLHVFNPVPRMKLVELAYPDAATSATRERAAALCAALEKEAVDVPDLAGFVVNRLLFPYLFSAVDFMEQTGLPPASIDTCMQLGAAHAMGPIGLLA